MKWEYVRTLQRDTGRGDSVTFMDIKYHFNKTSLQQLDRDLQVRMAALPTLHAKESALRAEVKRTKSAIKELKAKLEEETVATGDMERLWAEFPDILKVKELKISSRNIAGVKIPEFEGLEFRLEKFSLFNQPPWILSGIDILKRRSELRIKIKIRTEELNILDYARKKTTQKVNLYEKVQIPAYDMAIQKIKRFLEDEENLAKSSQKILKARKARQSAYL